MNRTTTWIALLAAVAVVAALIVFSGRTRTGARAFDEEPTVHLVVDPERGETRELKMEEYIQGVVGGEMGRLPPENGEERDWPHEAYAAQAILARSFALSFLDQDGIVKITADVEEAQAYRPENITPAIRRAVEVTRGQVMIHRGDYVKAWFHSYSGGHTATAKEGLNYQQEEPGFVKAVELPENEYVPEEHRSWSARIPLERVSEALAELGVAVGSVTDVEILERGPSGRATMLQVMGTSGRKEQVHAADLRVALGAEEMKSTLLEELRIEGDALLMRGRGFGHGVGLSQWDAYKMAQEGKSAEDILHAFFQEIEIERLWD